jgi:hypothetical protein
MALQEVGLATMAYFYFDFKDTDKQNLHNALFFFFFFLNQFIFRNTSLRLSPVVAKNRYI